jgi:hypothetical protein
MLNGYAEGQTSSNWTTAGDGTFDDPNILDATYTAGTSDISNGSVQLTLTAYATVPCTTNDSDSLLLTFVTAPTADAGSDGTTCGNNPYTLSGSATNYISILWSSSGDGIFSDPTLLDAEYLPGTGDIDNGNVTLTLTAGATPPCADAVDDMLLSIQGSPMANAGDDDGICQGETYNLSGNASNYATISWSTDGDGSFDDPNILDPVYTPGPSDIDNRGATLSLEATPIAPCTVGMIDAMNLGVDPMVGDPDTPAGPILVDSYITPVSEYAIAATPEANGYRWNMSPSDAGEISESDTTNCEVTWDPGFQGFAYIKVGAYNSCALIYSDSLEVEVTSTVGINIPDAKTHGLMIIPNPNTGTFKIRYAGSKPELELKVYDSQGNMVSQGVIGKLDPEELFEMSHLPKGIYIVKVQAQDVLVTEKIIIQ